MQSSPFHVRATPPSGTIRTSSRIGIGTYNLPVMRFLFMIAQALLVLACNQGPGDTPPNELPPAEIAGEVAAHRVSATDKTSDWPALAAATDGSLWTAYVEWGGADSDRIVVRRKTSDGNWREPVYIDDGNWDHYLPTIATVPGGAMAFWSGRDDADFDLYGTVIGDDGAVGEIEVVADGDHSDFHVRAVSDSDGTVTVVWQSFQDLHGEIYGRRRSAEGWGPQVRISSSLANDWEPSVALDSTGRAWISWDTYHAGNYDVMLASFDGAAASEPIAITSALGAEFHSSVAVDTSDRVWVAYDTALPNWGKDFSTSSGVEGSEGLHARRGLGIRLFANGRVFEPTADITEVLTGRMSRYAELPSIAIDGGGSIWIAFRHWTILKPHEMFHVYASRLGEQGWTTPLLLENSSGRNTQRTAAATGPSGAVHLAFSSDLRSPDNLPTDQMHALHYNVYAATLDPVASAAPELREIGVISPEPGFEARERATMTASGKTYSLLLGDCHRHTDVRGHSAVDGSIEDTYRYAIDAAKMDFVGPSDHNEVLGSRWPDSLRDYQWWYAQKLVDVYTHAPKFWGIYSYEHSMQRPGGHRNVLYLKRGGPLRPIDREKGPEAPDNAPPVMWQWMRDSVLTQAGQKTVIVPHTFAAGPLADWNWVPSPFDCLLEIYQGARGSYERWRTPEGEKRGGTQVDEAGHFAQDALNKGHKYGFVSFSDHGSTHNSWAAVWVDEPTREALFDAMLARRTFAASDEIYVKAVAAGHMVGEEFSASIESPPEIAIEIEAQDEILRVDVVKNGEYVYTARPGGRTATLSYKDSEAEPGESYYYVRAFQRDPEKPDGDPEIAWTSPFFVRYERAQ